MVYAVAQLKSVSPSVANLLKPNLVGYLDQNSGRTKCHHGGRFFGQSYSSLVRFARKPPGSLPLTETAESYRTCSRGPLLIGYSHLRKIKSPCLTFSILKWFFFFSIFLENIQGPVDLSLMCFSLHWYITIAQSFSHFNHFFNIIRYDLKNSRK